MLSETQTEILKNLKRKLVRGDIGKIAEATGLTTVSVGNTLSLSTDIYNEDVVAEAVRIIEKREQDNEKILKKLQAA